MKITKDQVAIPKTKGRGYKIIAFKEIAYCEADGGYTILHLSNGETFVASRNLGTLESNLPKDVFIRIHNKYLANRYHFSEISLDEQCAVILKDGTALSIAHKRKASVFAVFQKM